jgi:bifunctional non-homologous end joining protein LigD
MLARSGRGMPVDLDDWAIEPKWDGWRCLARIEGGAVRLTSRWRRDLTALFPELAELPSGLGARRLLLDGEIVALRVDGSQDFHALTRRGRRGEVRIAFMCFDVLHVDGHDLIDESYEARREELERLRMTQRRWLTTPSLRNAAGAALYGYTLTHGWEGVVAKRLDSAYRPASRDGAWLKAKHPHARDLQVDRSTWTMRVGGGESRVVY